MQNNDLSNELTKRVLIIEDTFAKVHIKVSTKVKFIKTTEKTVDLNKAMLSRLYLFAQKSGVTLELISFTRTSEELESFAETLEEMGTNPFRYTTSYDDPQDLVAELPYRPEVLGVVDIKARSFMYGHWGMDMPY